MQNAQYADNGARFFNSYRAAMAWMRRNPDSLARWSGGHGWVCEGRFCSWRRRVVTRSWNPTTGGHC